MPLYHKEPLYDKEAVIRFVQSTLWPLSQRWRLGIKSHFTIEPCLCPFLQLERIVLGFFLSPTTSVTHVGKKSFGRREISQSPVHVPVAKLEPGQRVRLVQPWPSSLCSKHDLWSAPRSPPRVRASQAVGRGPREGSWKNSRRTSSKFGFELNCNSDPEVLNVERWPNAARHSREWKSCILLYIFNIYGFKEGDQEQSNCVWFGSVDNSE